MMKWVNACKNESIQVRRLEQLLEYSKHYLNDGKNNTFNYIVEQITCNNTNKSI